MESHVKNLSWRFYLPRWQRAGWSSGKLPAGYSSSSTWHKMSYFWLESSGSFWAWEKKNRLSILWNLLPLLPLRGLSYRFGACFPVQRFTRRVKDDESTSSDDWAKVWRMFWGLNIRFESRSLTPVTLNTGTRHLMDQSRAEWRIFCQILAGFLPNSSLRTVVQWRTVRNTWTVSVPKRTRVDNIPVFINSQNSHFLQR